MEESFPYLNCELLSAEEKNVLKGRLVVESKTIRSKFATLLVQMDKSLRSENVLIQSLHVLLEPYKLPDLNESDDEIGEILRKAFRHCSFFNFEILKNITENFGTSKDKDWLNDYEAEFKVYCQRRLSEVPRNKENPTQKNEGAKFCVKTDKIFDCPAKEVYEIAAELTIILGKPVYLDGVEHGCVKLLCHVFHELFPLNMKQVDRLKEIGVTRIYDRHHEYYSKSKGM